MIWKLLFIAVGFFANTAFAAPEFKQTTPINICVFSNGIVLPCFLAEMDGEEVLVFLDDNEEVLAIARVKDGEVVKTLWRKDWKTI